VQKHVTFGIQSARSWLNEGGFEQWKFELYFDSRNGCRWVYEVGTSTASMATRKLVSGIGSPTIWRHDHRPWWRLEGLSVEGRAWISWYGPSRYQIDRHETCRKTVCRQRVWRTAVDTSTLYCASRSTMQCERTANLSDSLASEDVTESASLSSPSDRRALKSLSNRKIFPGPDRLEEGDYSTLWSHWTPWSTWRVSYDSKTTTTMTRGTISRP
jgi:hypothetical protein